MEDKTVIKEENCESSCKEELMGGLFAILAQAEEKKQVDQKEIDKEQQ